jgi:hypothetical protein
LLPKRRLTPFLPICLSRGNFGEVNMITQEELKEQVKYDPDTGEFTWLKLNPNNRVSKIGGLAGSKDSYGYTVIQLNNVRYKAHRLAWLYMNGEMPSKSIDHINGCTSDNRISNLRDVSHSENCKNQKVHKRNTTGYRGVSYFKANKKYTAYITVNYKRIHLGYFATIEDAVNKVKEARATLHGEFARD